MTNCKACGMPINSGDFCEYCTNPDGTVKSCQEIFEGGVQFYMNKIENDRQKAEKAVRKNMNSLPYWQENGCDCLNGEM